MNIKDEVLARAYIEGFKWANEDEWPVREAFTYTIARVWNKEWADLDKATQELIRKVSRQLNERGVLKKKKQGRYWVVTKGPEYEAALKYLAAHPQWGKETRIEWDESGEGKEVAGNYFAPLLVDGGLKPLLEESDQVVLKLGPRGIDVGVWDEIYHQIVDNRLDCFVVLRHKKLGQRDKKMSKWEGKANE